MMVTGEYLLEPASRRRGPFSPVLVRFTVPQRAALDSYVDRSPGCDRTDVILMAVGEYLRTRSGAAPVREKSRAKERAPRRPNVDARKRAASARARARRRRAQR